MRYHVYHGTALAVTFEYGRRPVYHGALGRRVRELLVTPGSSLAAAGFHILPADASSGQDGRPLPDDAAPPRSAAGAHAGTAR